MPRAGHAITHAVPILKRVRPRTRATLKACLVQPARVMNASIKLGRWFGVPVGLHYSWFVVAVLIALSLGTTFQQQNANWSPVVVWATAIVAALLFFVCIVLHELAH